jgi:hypothetical protein
VQSCKPRVRREEKVVVVRLIRMLGVALLWAAGVAFVASASWVAINSAGRQVVDGSVVSTTRSDRSDRSVSAPAGQTSAAGTPSGTPSARPRPATSSEPARRPGNVTGAQVSSSSPSGEATPTRASDVESGRMPGTPGPLPVSNTLPTPGGVLWLQCTDQVISDFLAQPGSDWSASAGTNSPGELEVHFTRRGVNIQVLGTCPGGEPHFTVRTDDGEHDGEHDSEHDSEHDG